MAFIISTLSSIFTHNGNNHTLNPDTGTVDHNRRNGGIGRLQTNLAPFAIQFFKSNFLFVQKGHHGLAIAR